MTVPFEDLPLCDQATSGPAAYQSMGKDQRGHCIKDDDHDVGGSVLRKMIMMWEDTVLRRMIMVWEDTVLRKMIMMWEDTVLRRMIMMWEDTVLRKMIMTWEDTY